VARATRGQIISAGTLFLSQVARVPACPERLKRGVFGTRVLGTFPTRLCSGRSSDRRRFNGRETRYFFGCGCASGGASLLGGMMFFIRMYVTRLP